MGSTLSGILGINSDYQANTGGQDFGSAIQQSQQGLKQNFQDQGSLAQALMAQANGSGPNPAQAMLNQATDNSIKQNTAMMASQKGINPGMVQRQAAMNAAQQGQQAAGQGATMQAQQQLGAQSQLGGLYGQMGQQHLGEMGQNQSALANQNQINAGVASANAAANGAAVGGLIQGAAAIGSMGATSGLSAAAGAASGASGMGGAASGAQFGGLGGNYKFSQGGEVPGSAMVRGDSPQNDTVHAKLSPGEIVIPRSKASDPAKAKEFIDHLMSGSKDKAESGASFGEIAKLKERIKALEARVKK